MRRLRITSAAAAVALEVIICVVQKTRNQCGLVKNKKAVEMTDREQ